MLKNESNKILPLILHSGTKFDLDTFRVASESFDIYPTILYLFGKFFHLNSMNLHSHCSFLHFPEAQSIFFCHFYIVRVHYELVLHLVQLILPPKKNRN